MHQSIGVSPTQLLFSNAIDRDRNILRDEQSKVHLDRVQELKDIWYREWADTMLLKQ